MSVDPSTPYLGVNIAHAATGSFSSEIGQLMSKINQVILNPLIGLMFAIALLVFLWGMVSFLANSDKGADEAEKGKRHMLWGVVGMFIMVAVFGIMQLVVNTLKAEDDIPQDAKQHFMDQ